MFVFQEMAAVIGFSRGVSIAISFGAAFLTSMYMQSFRAMLRANKNDKKSCCQDQDQSNQGENQ